MGLTVSWSSSSACAHMSRLFHGPDCFTVSTCCLYIDLGSRGYFGVNLALVSKVLSYLTGQSTSVGSAPTGCSNIWHTGLSDQQNEHTPILFGVWPFCLRCDMAFIEPMHRNKPNITYYFAWLSSFHYRAIELGRVMAEFYHICQNCSSSIVPLLQADTLFQHVFPFQRHGLVLCYIYCWLI